jgi:hypothetical protein
VKVDVQEAVKEINIRAMDDVAGVGGWEGEKVVVVGGRLWSYFGEGQLG